MKQVNELTTEELRRLLKLREEQDAILIPGEVLGEQPYWKKAQAQAMKTQKYTPDKPHWTQTAAGKRKMKAAINKSWAERKARQTQAGGGV